MVLDHLILGVNDMAESLRFYTRILGLVHEGPRPPFEVVRVTPELTLQLAAWGTKGGDHLAFALSPDEFDAVFRRIREARVAHGDSYHTVGNMQGPGEEEGSRGVGASLYFFDPNRHLLEIRHYGE